MIKTRIFQFVGHIHNMQLCIEIISFINHENESILRWFYSFCEPRNFSLCPRSLVGVYSGGLGVWFMTFCCCLVEFGSSCFNHAWIESWFVWFGPWYTTGCICVIRVLKDSWTCCHWLLLPLILFILKGIVYPKMKIIFLLNCDRMTVTRQDIQIIK